MIPGVSATSQLLEVSIPIEAKLNAISPCFTPNPLPVCQPQAPKPILSSLHTYAAPPPPTPACLFLGVKLISSDSERQGTPLPVRAWPGVSWLLGAPRLCTTRLQLPELWPTDPEALQPCLPQLWWAPYPQKEREALCLNSKTRWQIGTRRQAKCRG